MSEIDDVFCEELLSEYGYVEKEVAILGRDECDCGSEIKKMSTLGDCLVCSDCGMVKNVYDDGGSIAKGPSTFQVGSRTYTCYGSGTRDKEDKIADLVTSYKNLISSNNHAIDGELLNRTCTIMFTITQNHIKKKDNRLTLFAALLYLTSIKMDVMLLPNSIKMMLGKEKIRFSKGLKTICNSVLMGEIEPDQIGFDEKIYNKLIAKYLSLYNPNHDNSDANINTTANRRFCITFVEVMLDQNIAYNSIIKTKCIAVIYYLIRIKKDYRWEDEQKQRKYFASIVDVGENTFMKVYSALLTKEVQGILVSTGMFTAGRHA